MQGSYDNSFNITSAEVWNISFWYRLITNDLEIMDHVAKVQEFSLYTWREGFQSMLLFILFCLYIRPFVGVNSNFVLPVRRLSGHCA